MSSSPLGLVLEVMCLLVVLTPISAWQLEWRNAGKVRGLCIPQSLRNLVIVGKINSSPPSEAHSFGMPKVGKM